MIQFMLHLANFTGYAFVCTLSQNVNLTKPCVLIRLLAMPLDHMFLHT